MQRHKSASALVYRASRQKWRVRVPLGPTINRVIAPVPFDGFSFGTFGQRLTWDVCIDRARGCPVMPNDLQFARTAQQEWLSNWRRCVHVYGWQQRQTGSQRGTTAVRSIGTRNPSEGRSRIGSQGIA